MRALKYHEEKLLKKTSLYDWKDSHSIIDSATMNKYGVYDRRELITYRQTMRKIRHMVELLTQLPQDNNVRIELTRRLSRTLYDMGVVDNPQAGLDDISGLNSSALLLRRLPCIMMKLKMVQKIQDGVRFVKQGHVRVGPNVVVNPALHVTRGHEDFVTWTNNSSIKRKILRYADNIDHYDLLNQ
ncbi:putative SSU ribosomal protein S4P/U3 small nucleolar ribonucleoprotein IMP3 [Giardia duodenalis assemblage B]|uniref:U3 small nucleolar ribonucleoprotein protein IMP3, putative n=3 Tax=Giardia intestinalis TaxID=5741 RepID=C6LS09_GIAIB|nr:U3 small nucleolar ribonucleoprotein protein IMP3, putative [Giardia intestinalis ATCC 50581]ESU40999.1 SSU ribosomal protein S4P [Giardia intestinalis]KWX11520.1 putative SSU ribosomal protein S4P/U3 small nucleolar ribonucleoprotein IMP3 [Giardia intestinalis assemblage B]